MKFFVYSGGGMLNLLIMFVVTFVMLLVYRRLDERSHQKQAVLAIYKRQKVELEELILSDEFSSDYIGEIDIAISRGEGHITELHNSIN